MKINLFETTSTSPKKSFGKGNQEIYGSRVQMRVDELSWRFLAIPRLPPSSDCPFAISEKANRVDHWVVSRRIFGCLTDLFIFIYQDSESAQTLRGRDPPMHHLSRAKFLGRLPQRYRYRQEITVFVFLKTFFLRASSYRNCHPNFRNLACLNYLFELFVWFICLNYLFDYI